MIHELCRHTNKQNYITKTSVNAQSNEQNSTNSFTTKIMSNNLSSYSLYHLQKKIVSLLQTTL